MIESIKALEEYLQANNMSNTLQIFRSQLSSKFPQLPSQQFYKSIQQNPVKKAKITRRMTHNHNNSYTSTTATTNSDPSKRSKNSQKEQLAVQGILGKIVYSGNLLQDQSLNNKIQQMINRPFFIKAYQKLFPEQNKKTAQKQQNKQTTIQFPEDITFQKKDPNTDIENKCYTIQEDESSEKRKALSASKSSKQFDDYFNCDLNLFIPQKKQAQISSQSSSKIQIQASDSIISQPSIVLHQLLNSDVENQDYIADGDPGYIQYIFDEKYVILECSKLKSKYKYPQSAVKPHSKKPIKKKQISKKLQSILVFPQSKYSFYPVEYNEVIYDVFPLKIIGNRQKTGYQPHRNLRIKKNDLIAGRYRIKEILGSGVFAKAYAAYDQLLETETCLKMIINNKDYFDQALDEIKMLRIIKQNCNVDNSYLLQFKSIFYFREHLFIQTELLLDNLYIAYKKNPTFFSIPVIRQISKQILIGLNTLHKLHIIHADLKPENILIKSYDPIVIKIVDLGNSFFFHDKVGGYIQSRNYRAPEILLGVLYDQKIDIWGAGCIIAELWTKNLLFDSPHIPGMLAKIQNMAGPWPQWMLTEGNHTEIYFSKEYLIYYEESEKYHILIPKKNSIKSHIRIDDEQFLQFLQSLLTIDPRIRPDAQQALNYSFLAR